MKKVINGRVYDTATAKELAVWNNDFGVGDFSHECETLYQKKTGEFFLHGKGGPMSRYATPAYGSPNGWTGGELVTPLSYEEAQKWAEARLEADEYEAIFGVPEEDEITYVKFKISSKAKAKLDELRAKKGLSIAETMEEIISNYRED